MRRGAAEKPARLRGRASLGSVRDQPQVAPGVATSRVTVTGEPFTVAVAVSTAVSGGTDVRRVVNDADTDLPAATAPNAFDPKPVVADIVTGKPSALVTVST